MNGPDDAQPTPTNTNPETPNEAGSGEPNLTPTGTETQTGDTPPVTDTATDKAAEAATSPEKAPAEPAATPKSGKGGAGRRGAAKTEGKAEGKAEGGKSEPAKSEGKAEPAKTEDDADADAEGATFVLALTNVSHGTKGKRYTLTEGGIYELPTDVATALMAQGLVGEAVGPFDPEEGSDDAHDA